jgi:hypothetical protein
MCHAKISEAQHLSKNPRLRSCFNPEVMELFDATPKPKQIHWGLGAVGEEGPLDTIWSVDINGCRRNALLLAESLPSFNFTDEPEPYNPAHQYDFLWVDNGVDLEGEGHCGCVARGKRIDCEFCSGSGIPEKRLMNAPYDGPHLYPMVAVRYLLDRDIITHDHITWGLRAAQRVQIADLKKTLDLAEGLIRKIYAGPKVENDVKRAMLSLIGVWGKPHTIE